jgi:hypothetical protein
MRHVVIGLVHGQHCLDASHQLACDGGIVAKVQAPNQISRRICGTTHVTHLFLVIRPRCDPSFMFFFDAYHISLFLSCLFNRLAATHNQQRDGPAFRPRPGERRCAVRRLQ